MRNNKITMRPTNIMLEPDLKEAASKYAASLPDPLSLGALTRHLLRVELLKKTRMENSKRSCKKSVKRGIKGFHHYD